MNAQDKMSTYWAVAAGLAVLAAVIVVGAWYYRSQSRFVHRRAVDTLVSIGRLKADEIAAWREERLGDAATLQEDPHISELAARYFAAPNDPNARPLLGRFRMMARHFGYADVVLVDDARQIRLSLSNEACLHDEFESALAQAVRERRPVLTDLHGGESGEPHLSAVAPLFASEAPEAALLGAVVLVSDASRYLFPLLNTWPTPCQTAETTLSRRDGEDVLFLNVLRHQTNDVNGLRVPLSRRALPAVRAALGEQGVMEGVDYRERPVVAFATRVAGTGWSLVAKQDTEEIFADWRFRSRLILAAMIALVCGIFAGVLAVWRHAQTRHYRDLYASEARLRASTERHSITLKAIGDAVLVTDNQGRVELLNPVAEHLTGWSSAEACGLPLERVFDIINEETRARVPSPVERVLREGEVVGLANHTLLIARDGSECPIADSAAPIHDAQGGITGVVLVFRDQTLEQNYRVLFQRMMDGFAVHEMVRDESGQPTDYRFIAVNPAFERMTGLRAADVVGRTIREVMPGIEQHWIETYDRVVTTGVPVHFERYAAQFDKYFDVAAFRPTLNQFATIIQDITPRKQTERELQESERKYRSLTDDVLDTTEVGIFILDAAFNIVWVNRTMGRFFCFERDEVIGKPKRDLIRQSIARIFEEPERFAATVLATYDDNTYTEQFECHVLPGEGREERWLQHWSQPVASGLYAGGRIEHYYDITERKQNEAQQRRLVSALEQSGESVLVTDQNATILYVNQAFERLTGYSWEDVAGQTPRILHSGKHSKTFYRAMWETLKRGEVYRGRLVNRRKDGTHFTEDISIAPVTDDAGRIVNYVAVAQDVSDRLRLEAELQQAQKMETVGRLAGGVAHDFNNMLGVILGNAELALESLGSASPLRADLEEIIHAAKRSSEITQQLLAFARKQMVTPRVLDLNQAVDGMLKMLGRLVGENISLHWEPGAPAIIVEIDPSQLHQILANLCVNARDAITDVGVITIRTAIARVDAPLPDVQNHESAPGLYATLSVSDTGCGMDPETIAHLFEPFYTTKGVGKGTGLGLATVLGIVQQNNGFIRVGSEPWKGTVFTVHLPLRDDAPEETAPEDREALPDGRGETVLIAEDEAAVLRLSRSILEKLGYTVLAASSPKEAWQLAENHAGTISLLLTDVIMPGMNGRDLAKLVRQKYPGVRCLFMSGYTANVIAHHGVLDDDVFFIQKPFSTQELAACVKKVLGHGDDTGQTREQEGRES